MSLPTHITARSGISLFGVCLRCLSVLGWKNSRICGSLTAPHGGITLTTRVFHSQHYTLSNSYKLVRAPGLLCRYWPPHRSPMAQRPQAFVSSLQLTHTAIRPQIQAGSTRIVASDVMSATLAEAATQLSFAEFSERCNLYRASPPHPQPSLTLLLDTAAQTPSHSVASADATTQQPLTEFFLGCIYSKDPLDRSAPPPTHGNASSASLPQPTDIATICSSQQHQPHL